MQEWHRVKIQFKTIEYDQEKNEITILDQTRLPEAEVYLNENY